ncbi:ependymin-related protein 1-like [Mytilus trossulus]|uniref:ependymin-related protein 1-like n=1 Tax=Mytilus trossulus TaxID=6551 RepID=UPI003006431B
MYAARGEGLVLIVLLTRLCASTSTPVCCAPNQWEGRLYVDFFVFPYAIHTYGTADVAYDFINSRTVINATLVEESPFADPKKKQYSTLYLEDYTNYYEYELDNRGNCQKTKLDVNMTKQCVQGDDSLLYSGKVGEHIITDTYNITLDKSNPNIRATIERGSCVPVHLYVTHKVDMSTVDVYNVTPGIKDTKIFDIPPQCKHDSPKHRRTMESMHVFQLKIRETLQQVLFGGRKE